MLVPPAYCQETEDSQVFIAGFNAYQQKDFATAIEKMNEVLQKYPDTPLRDMALFWLARSYYKTGNQHNAARYLAQFSKEYPDNPLKSTVEDELTSLVARYEKGEKLSTGAPLPKPVDKSILLAKAEKERQAREKADQERIAREKAEAERQAQAKADAARITAEKAAKEQAEQQRIAALKAEEDRKAAAKAEQDRIAQAKAEEARKAAEAAEAARVAAAKQQQERLRAEQAEQQRLAAEKIALEKAAAEKAEQQRLAELKQQEEQKAAAAAEKQRLEREQAEQARIAALRQEEQRLAAEKAVQERMAAEKLEQERLAKLQAEQERLAAGKTAQEQIAQAKAEEARTAAAAAEAARLAAARKEQERQAAEKAEQERLAAVKAEQQRLAQEKAEQQRLAAEKSALEKAAAEKAEQERQAKAAAEQQRIASAKAEQERLAAETKEKERIAASTAAEESAARQKAEEQRVAALKAEEARMAAEKAEVARQAAIRQEEERLAAAAAEKARVAAARQEQERLAAERAAAEAEAVRVAAVTAEEQKQAKIREAEEKNRLAKTALREKAIAQYKSIIEQYPGTTAATAAAAKLRELGIAVAVPQVAAVEQLPENAQVLRLEVAQFAGFEFNLLSRPEAFVVGRRISVPFEITNRGNGSDSFSLESGFPAGFSAGFASAAAPDQAIAATPVLAPGDVFKGVVNLTIPTSSIDGLRITHPVKAASRFMAEASQSREVAMTASAPLLRAVVKTEKTQPLPGDKVVYRIAVLNVGSTVAQDVTFRLNYPPQLEPLDYAAAGFKLDGGALLRFDGLQVQSGESREFTVTFQLKGDSMAGQELSTRAELINNPLKTTAAFMSNVAYVKPQYGILVRAISDRKVVVPGQTITVPFVVTNTGNVREKFKVASSITGAQEAVVFLDLNRDGLRQASEPVVSEIGPLSPKEEVNVVMEIKTPRTAVDTSEGSARVSFVSEGDSQQAASGSAQLVYSRPVLKLAMAGQEGRLKPGEVAWFDLSIANNGSNLARVVELQSTWPEQLELVAADPAISSTSGGKVVWRFKELGAGEKRSIKVSFRVKPGTGVGTNIQVKNIMTYEDQLGNRY